MTNNEQIAQVLAIEYVRKHTTAQQTPIEYANEYLRAYNAILAQLKAAPNAM